MYTLGKTQYLRLQGYLYDLHLSGRVCVFSELSGHVDGWTIRIVDSKEKYNTNLYGNSSNWIYIRTDYKPSISDRQLVDDIISDIEDAIAKRDSIVEKVEQDRLAAEKAEYERLKEKYEL